MVLFFEAQKKAQEELDRVIGRERLPTWGDEKNLPYVRSLIKEVLVSFLSLSIEIHG
jgi:hypothetical protein